MAPLSVDFRAMLDDLVKQSEWSLDEHPALIQLLTLFIERTRPPDPYNMFPRYDVLRSRLIDAVQRGDVEETEEAFLTLYCHVHGHEAPYTKIERRTLDALGGYWCHAGGISPILKAGPYLSASSVSVDLGAGNGLQGLLMQTCHPHKLTIQIELSSTMVAVGQGLAAWLDLPEEAVEWRVGDVRDFIPTDADFIYLYRPLRPEGPGILFYQTLAKRLAALEHPVTIFSIADCLAPFLPPEFHIFHTDGHLTCIGNDPAPYSTPH